MAMTVFELLGRIALDNTSANKGIDDTTGRAEKAKEKIGDAFEKIGHAAVVTGKAIATGLAAGATAVGALVKSSVDGYAEYEQLVGGVETLFKDSSSKVREYAAEAYNSAGLSANEYMSTVTSFSASLLQGLGGNTEAAAEAANKAIVDMSDNANKMGTDMALIQNAYQGFAKQNYTMLDNLKLGYGGTATEMARLINESGVLGDTIEVTADTVNEVSFDKIIEAIHVVQEDMGIAGATAAEAATTIEGSTKAMQAAWKNLVTGMADETADLELLVDQFVETAGTAAENILPRVEIALEGAGKLIDKLFPIIIEKVPTIINDFLPKILQSGVSIVQNLIAGIRKNKSTISATALEASLTFVNAIGTMLPQILELGVELLLTLADGICENLDELSETAGEMVGKIVETLTDGETLSRLFEASAKIVLALVEGITNELAPSLSPVVEAFKWLADRVEIVIGVLGAAATAFVTYKAAVLAAEIAQKGLAAVIGATTVAQTALNAVQNATTTGILITAVAGLVAGFAAYCGAVNKATAEVETLTQEERELIASAESAAEAFQKQKAATLESGIEVAAQMAHVTALADELILLADSSGKVEEADRARAEFILGELNAALGTEYTMIDGVIQGYKELEASIYDVIQAKTIEALLEDGHADYITAVKEKDKALKAVTATNKDYITQLQKTQAAEEELAAAREDMDKALLDAAENHTMFYANAYQQRIDQADAALQDELEILSEKKEAWDDAAYSYNDYCKKISSYEDAQVAASEGNYQKARELLIGKEEAYIEFSDTVDEETARVLNTLAQEAIDAGLYAEQTKENFENGIAGYTQEMVDEAERGYENALTAFGTAYSDAEKVGGDIGLGLVDGMEAKRGSVISKIRSLVNSIIGAANEEAGVGVSEETEPS